MCEHRTLGKLCSEKPEVRKLDIMALAQARQGTGVELQRPRKIGRRVATRCLTGEKVHFEKAFGRRGGFTEDVDLIDSDHEPDAACERVRDIVADGFER